MMEQDPILGEIALFRLVREILDFTESKGA